VYLFHNNSRELSHLSWQQQAAAVAIVAEAHTKSRTNGSGFIGADVAKVPFGTDQDKQTKATAAEMAISWGPSFAVAAVSAG